MAKKMFLPARLAKKADRWELVFYQTNPKTGIRQRFRETRDLNRIHDLNVREREAEREIKAMNRLLPFGYPFRTESEQTMTVLAAAQRACGIKSKNTTKEESRRTYKCQLSVFQKFLTWAKLESLDVREFGKGHVQKFVDYLQHDHVWKRGKKSSVGVSNKKINDYTSSMSAFWNELISRDLIEANPFANRKRLKASPTERRCFTIEERKAVFAWLFEHDRRLFYAAMLQFSCLIRGTALRELRFSMIDFSTGVISLPGRIEKNSKPTFKTIPLSLLKYFAEPDFHNHPTNWLVFGAGMLPNKDQRCSRSEFNRRLQLCFLKMKKEGLVEDTTNLTFYSNKNTGITEMLARLPLMDVVNQAGHADPRTTMIYYGRPKQIDGLKSWEVSAFD